MRRFYQSAIVTACMGLAFAVARCMLLLFGPVLARHSPLASELTKHTVNDFGHVIDSIFNAGYYSGMMVGVIITLALLGGLAAGVALARRLNKPDRTLELTVV